MTTLFKSLDKQELFDFAYNGVIAQNACSVNSVGVCAYHITDADGNSLHCGVGHCMSTEGIDEYGSVEADIKTVLEHAGAIITSETRSPKAVVYLDMVQLIEPNTHNTNIIEFLCTLQSAHDDTYDGTMCFNNDYISFLTEFKGNMARIAKANNLVLPTT